MVNSYNDYSEFDDLDIFSVYMKDIENYPLLTEDETQELFIKYKDGDLKAREKLINSNLRLVLYTLKTEMKINYLNRNVMDFIQIGNMALVKAVDKFDCTRGIKFSTYAIEAIKRNIRIESNKMMYPTVLPKQAAIIISKLIKCENDFYKLNEREPQIEDYVSELGVSKEVIKPLLSIKDSFLSLDSTPDEFNDDPTNLYYFLASDEDVCEEVTNKVYIETLWKEIKRCLNEKEFELLLLRLGEEVDGKGSKHPMTFTEMAERNGTTRQALQVSVKKTTEKIKRKCKDKKINF